MTDYYKEDNMRDVKISDLRDNPEFLQDAVDFLTSRRRGYTSEDLADKDGDWVTNEVLEHFRYANTNEVSMAKDYNFVNDDAVPENQRQAYGRLLFAFDNAKGEGLLDGSRGIAAVGDYLGGMASAPSTWASVAAGALTGGAGGAAVQGTKIAAQAGVRQIAKKLVGRAAFAAGVDGSLAAGSAYGVERIKEDTGELIGEDYEVSTANVAVAGVLGGALGGAAYAIPAMSRNRAAGRFVDVLDTARQVNAEEIMKAQVLAKENLIKAFDGKDEVTGGKRLARFTTDKLLRSIDPKLVEEGMAVKMDILSGDVDEELINGLTRGHIQRLGAAAYDLASKLRVKPEEGQRITEYLARSIEANDIFSKVAKDYGLTKRQLSSVYAAEVSEAARILVGQKNLVSRSGKGIDTKTAKEFANEMEALYERGMSTLGAEDVEKLMAVEKLNQPSPIGRVGHFLKNIESARRAFMTSQPATTMRNNIFGVAMVGVDMIDNLGIAAVRAVKGSGNAMQTFKGTMDNLKYLSGDAYVAEAVTKMLSEQAPEQMSKVFFAAAQAESALVGNTRLAKAGAFVNTLNTASDHIFKRAVVAGTIDRELKVLNNPALGTNLMDMLKKGTLSQLPDDILAKALDDSLAFTFQRRLGGKDASTESKAAKWAVDTINKTGLTVLMPFPRYMASQAKFISDYTGLTVGRRFAFGDAVKEEDYAKAMTGLVTFTGLYQAQGWNIDNDREWFEAEGNTGNVINAQAAMGPAATTAYVANLVKRGANGLPMKDASAIIKDLGKLVLGTEFRPGSGLISKVGQAVDAGSMDPVMNEVGDYFSSFTYPAAAVKDFYGQFDPRSAYLPETRDPSMTAYTNILTDLLPFDVSTNVFRRITRQLPDFPDNGGVTGNLLNFLADSTRLTYQSRYSKDADSLGLGYDAMRFDVFGDGPMRSMDPLMKQITGFSGMPPKNAFQRELTRLQLDPFKLYNPYIEKNVALTLLTEQLMQGNVARTMEGLISSDAYQAMSVEEQTRNVTDGFANLKNTYKGRARDLLTSMEGAEGFEGDFLAYQRGEYRKIDKGVRAYADLEWQGISEQLGYEDMTFNEAIESVQNDESLNEEEKATQEAAMLMNYQLMGKAAEDRRSLIR